MVTARHSTVLTTSTIATLALAQYEFHGFLAIFAALTYMPARSHPLAPKNGVRDEVGGGEGGGGENSFPTMNWLC